MAKFVRRFLEGIKVDKETLAYDVIETVGQSRNFLMEDHTLKHIKPEERTDYQIFNRVVPEIWEQQGMPSIMDNAKKTADKILAEHKVEPLEKSVKEKIAEIIKDFEGTF